MIVYSTYHFPLYSFILCRNEDVDAMLFSNISVEFDLQNLPYTDIAFVNFTSDFRAAIGWNALFCGCSHLKIEVQVNPSEQYCEEIYLSNNYFISPVYFDCDGKKNFSKEFDYIHTYHEPQKIALCHYDDFCR